MSITTGTKQALREALKGYDAYQKQTCSLLGCPIRLVRFFYQPPYPESIRYAKTLLEKGNRSGSPTPHPETASLSEEAKLYCLFLTDITASESSLFQYFSNNTSKELRATFHQLIQNWLIFPIHRDFKNPEFCTKMTDSIVEILQLLNKKELLDPDKNLRDYSKTLNSLKENLKQAFQEQDPLSALKKKYSTLQEDSSSVPVPQSP